MEALDSPLGALLAIFTVCALFFSGCAAGAWCFEQTRRIKVVDGIAMIGRVSVGWNWHSTRNIRTMALPLAFTIANGEGGPRWLVTFGPVTFVWLRDER